MAYFKYRNKFIYYGMCGQGDPLVFLHGNTASSKMFEPIVPLYVEKFRCIFIDFAGNGLSERVDRFPTDMWYDEALQTIALIEQLQCGKVSIIGTSGGAWAAVNAALERPDLIRSVIADSFDGRTLNEKFSDNLLFERRTAKQNMRSRQFYEWCQGADWERVVDLDTEALLKCAEEKRQLFSKPLEEMRVPVLFVGSKADEMCRNNLEEEYREMAAVIPKSAIHLFLDGGHPSIFSNAEKFSELVKRFLECTD